jgi:hypothetical protein
VSETAGSGGRGESGLAARSSASRENSAGPPAGSVACRNRPGVDHVPSSIPVPVQISCETAAGGVWVRIALYRRIETLLGTGFASRHTAPSAPGVSHVAGSTVAGKGRGGSAVLSRTLATGLRHPLRDAGQAPDSRAVAFPAVVGASVRSQPVASGLPRRRCFQSHRRPVRQRRRPVRHRRRHCRHPPRGRRPCRRASRDRRGHRPPAAPARTAVRSPGRASRRRPRGRWPPPRVRSGSPPGSGAGRWRRRRARPRPRRPPTRSTRTGRRRRRSAGPDSRFAS